MKKILFILTLTTLVACGGITNIDRFESGVTAKQFNDVTSNYEDRPSFTSIRHHSNDTVSLTITMDLYGNGISTRDFDSALIPKYIEVIDKYISWESKAAFRGDIFTKEIATIKAGGMQSDYKYKFMFHSGNDTDHYLVVTVCTFLMCLPENDQVYNLDNAKILKSALLDFKARGIKAVNVSNEYN